MSQFIHEDIDWRKYTQGLLGNQYGYPFALKDPLPEVPMFSLGFIHRGTFVLIGDSEFKLNHDPLPTRLMTRWYRIPEQRSHIEPAIVFHEDLSTVMSNHWEINGKKDRDSSIPQMKMIDYMKKKYDKLLEKFVLAESAGASSTHGSSTPDSQPLGNDYGPHKEAGPSTKQAQRFSITQDQWTMDLSWEDRSTPPQVTIVYETTITRRYEFVGKEKRDGTSPKDKPAPEEFHCVLLRYCTIRKRTRPNTEAKMIQMSNASLDPVNDIIEYIMMRINHWLKNYVKFAFADYDDVVEVCEKYSIAAGWARTTTFIELLLKHRPAIKVDKGIASLRLKPGAIPGLELVEDAAHMTAFKAHEVADQIASYPINLLKETLTVPNLRLSQSSAVGYRRRDLLLGQRE